MERRDRAHRVQPLLLVRDRSTGGVQAPWRRAGLHASWRAGGNAKVGRARSAHRRGRRQHRGRVSSPQHHLPPPRRAAGRPAGAVPVPDDRAAGRASPAAQKGVRPFVVNAANTRVYLTWTASVASLSATCATAGSLATRNFGPIPPGFRPTSASHGISLNPSGTRVYVLDAPLRQVRVYTTGSSPRHVATIRLPDGLRGSETPCRYDCLRDGWLLHSLSGRYVFVGDSGDVIRTGSRRWSPSCRRWRILGTGFWRSSGGTAGRLTRPATSASAAGGNSPLRVMPATPVARRFWPEVRRGRGAASTV